MAPVDIDSEAAKSAFIASMLKVGASLNIVWPWRLLMRPSKFATQNKTWAESVPEQLFPKSIDYIAADQAAIKHWVITLPCLSLKWQ